QRIASDIPVRTGQRLKERAGIEVLICAAKNYGTAEILIHRRSNRIARVTVVRRVVGKLRRERQARLKRLNRTDLPIADESVEPWRLAVGKRQIVSRVEHSRVTNIEGSPAVVAFGIEWIRHKRGRVSGDTGVHVVAVVERFCECVSPAELQSFA